MSGRIEDIERRRHHRSPYPSQGSDDGYEEGRRHRHRRNKDGMDDVKVKISKFLGTDDLERSEPSVHGLDCITFKFKV